MHKRNGGLPIEDLLILQSIFETKHWKTTDLHTISKFDLFCHLLENLSLAERRMILEMTKSFIWVESSDYLYLFKKAFDQLIHVHDMTNKSKLILCPLLAIKDIQKNKSSKYLIYLIKGEIEGFQNDYPDINLNIVDSPKKIVKDGLESDAVLCLVDDFIGSGETADSAISYLVENGVQKDSIVLLSLVCMREGRNRIISEGFQVYSDIVCDKGITGTEKENEWRGLMSSIEEAINVDSTYSFGYAKSESLVRMIRTPNNTFPIYWYNESGKNPYAPFSRSLK